MNMKKELILYLQKQMSQEQPLLDLISGIRAIAPIHHSHIEADNFQMKILLHTDACTITLNIHLSTIQSGTLTAFQCIV